MDVNNQGKHPLSLQRERVNTMQQTGKTAATKRLLSVATMAVLLMAGVAAGQDVQVDIPRPHGHPYRIVDKADHAEIRVVPTPGPVTIDGRLDDWDLSGSILMCLTEVSKEVYAVRGALMYDAVWLYVGGQVKDPTPMMSKGRSKDTDPLSFAGENPEETPVADSVALHIIANPYVMSSTVPFISDLDLWYSTPTAKVMSRLRHRRPSRPGTAQFERPELNRSDVEGAYSKDADGKGYSFEYRIAWKALRVPRPLVAGDRIQFHWVMSWGNEAGSDVLYGLTDISPAAHNRHGIAGTYAYPNTWGEAVFESAGKLDPGDRPRSKPDDEDAMPKLSMGTLAMRRKAFAALQQGGASTGEVRQAYVQWMNAHAATLEPAMRPAAALAALRLDAAGAAPHLVKWLDADPTPYERSVVLYVLGELRAREALETVRILAKRAPPSWTRLLAREAAEKIDGKRQAGAPCSWPGEVALLSAIELDDALERCVAGAEGSEAVAGGAMAAPASIRLCLQPLSGTERERRIAAMLSAGGIESLRKAMPVLQEAGMLGDVARAYGGWLKACADNLAVSLRPAAAMAALEWKATAAGPYLLKWLNATPPPGERAVREVWVPTVNDFVEEPLPPDFERAVLLYVLGELRERGALDAVRDFTKRGRPWTRLLAREAAEKIEGRRKPGTPDSWPGERGLWLALKRSVQVSNVACRRSVVAGRSEVSFDLYWENSWRAKWTEPGTNNVTGKDLPVENWDAAWVFVKFRPKGGTNGFSHATLAVSGADHGAPAGAKLDVGLSDDGTRGLGAFLYRATPGVGTNDWCDIRLCWLDGADGVSDAGAMEVKVYAVEMVYVPQGPYALGSGGEECRVVGWSTPRATDSAPYVVKSGGVECGHFHRADDPGKPFVVASEEPITLASKGAGNLWGVMGTNNGPMQNVHAVHAPAAPADGSVLSRDFPKGYRAFYCMKYELESAEYAEFLNALPGAEAELRHCRQFGSGGGCWPVVHHEGVYEPNPGFRVCAWLSWLDGASYAAWAGLRTMSELEFEKACRGPRAPLPKDFPWGTWVPPALSFGEMMDNSPAGLELKEIVSRLRHAPLPSGSGVAGRVDIEWHTNNDALRGKAPANGASYWGIRDLAGNVSERVVTTGLAEGCRFRGSHGNGTTALPTDWPQGKWPNDRGAGCRGGEWPGVFYHANMQVAVRLHAANSWDRAGHGTGGARAARTAP